jgi:protein involved in polysaccharide export with SLBB domain
MRRRNKARVTSTTRAGGPPRLIVARVPSSEAPRRRGRRLVSMIVGCVLLLGGAVGALATAQSKSGSSSEAADTLPLKPGDLVRLRVWREPDLSGEFPVNETGVAVLPQLGPVDVTSVSADVVKAKITQELEVFLNHSSVDVAFLRRVQVLGAVQKPGLYHVEPTMTIGDALALAGGVLSNGRPDKVEIIREGQKLPGTVSGRILISHSPIRSGDQLYVPERSWISRNTGTILAGLSTVTALLYAFTH